MAKATAMGQVAIKLLLNATAEPCTRNTLVKGQFAVAALSASGSDRMEDVANACAQSSRFCPKRIIFHGVSQLGASRTSNGVQGFHCGGTCHQPRHTAKGAAPRTS